MDSQNKFLSRTYLADKEKRQINGQALGISSEVGIKFVASFLFISYEAVIASGTFGATRTFNDWKKIDDYWNSATSGLSLASLQMAAAQSGMQVASASATLQSRDYLEQYARTWGQPQQRMMLLSLNSPSGLESIQTNANPTSYPQLSDDGKVLAYINDGNSSSIYDSRAHFSTLNGGVYTPSSEIDAPTEFPGYGDTSVSLSGTGSFAAAAWVRMGTDLPGKNAGDPVTLEEQNLLMNSTEIVASVYSGSAWTSTRLTNDGTPDLAPATAVGGDGKAIVFWRSVYTPDPGTQGSNNLLNFTTRDCIMYRCYDSGTWSEAKMLYNGATGRVKALQAAMLPDGTATRWTAAEPEIPPTTRSPIVPWMLTECPVQPCWQPVTAILTKTPRSLQPTSASGMTDLSSVGIVSETAAAIFSCWLWTAAAPCPTVSPALCLP